MVDPSLLEEQLRAGIPQFFSDDELANLPSDPLDAAEIICDRWEQFVKGDWSGTDPESLHNEFLRWFVLAQVFLESNKDIFGVAMPKLGVDMGDNIKNIRSFFGNLINVVSSLAIKRMTQNTVATYHAQIAAAMGQRLVFTFSDSDYSRMQKLINELRDLISKSEKIVDNHKTRLLRRLEQLQGEVHKTVGDVDRALGVILEVSAVARKIGEDMKPLSDRAREMAEIIMRVIASFQGFPRLTLPDLTDQKPQLPSADNSDGKDVATIWDGDHAG